MFDEVFIGRQEEQERLWRDVFGLPAEEMGPCYSLIGPNNIGKTMLIAQMAKRFMSNPVPNVYYISTTLKDASSEWMFLIMLVCCLKNEVPEERLRMAPNTDEKYISDILKAYRFFDDPENWDNTESVKFNIRATQHWNLLFSGYRGLGIRLIISIDEFDHAKKLCKEGMLFSKLFGLSPKANQPSGHSVILISRRSVPNIEHHMQGGSVLASGYPTILLRGFNNSELEEYFNSYSNLTCGVPNEESRQQILYYCGRNPGLLMLMRHEAEMLGSGNMINVQNLYFRKRSDFEDAYNRLCALMKDEQIDSAVEIKCYEIFLEAFIGPVSSEPEVFKLGLEGLENHGFALQTTGNSDIYTLSGLDDETENNGTVYEPLSPYFVQYVANKYLSAENENLCNLLVHTEVMLRDAIDEIGTFLYGDTWNTVIDNFLPIERQTLRQSFFKRLQESEQENNAIVRGIRNSMLNVLSFKDYLDLSRQNWDSMHGFYRGFETNAAVQRAIECLYNARNLHSHKNFKILDRAHCTELRGVCNQMISGIEQTIKEFRQNPDLFCKNNSEIEMGAQEETSDNLPDTEAMNQYVGMTVQMVGQRVGQRGNLSGEVVLDGDTYRISIPNSSFQLRELNPKDLIGKSIDVIVMLWDANKASPHFVAEFIDADIPQKQQFIDESDACFEATMIGQIVTLQSQSMKNNGNIVGTVTIGGKEYSASIPRNTMRSMGLSALSIISRPCPVKITRWDPNPENNHFNVEPINVSDQ